MAFVGDDEGGRRCSRISSRATAFTRRSFYRTVTLPGVENPILEKVRSGGSGQTFAIPTKKKVSEQMEVASAPTYASILKKSLKTAPVTVHSF